MVKQLLIQRILSLIFLLMSHAALGVEQGRIIVNTTHPSKVFSLPVPMDTMLINSQITIFSQNNPLDAKVSYDLLWHQKGVQRANIRVLNIVFDQVLQPQRITVTWQKGHIDIKESRNEIRYQGELVYPNINWLRQVLLLTNNQGVDEEWYRHNQQLIAIYLADEEALTKNKYPRRVASQWLYDRPQAFYQLYLATVDLKWKKNADRFVEFYKSQINDEGFFKLSKPKDVKYLMGRSLVYDYLLNQSETAKKTLINLYKGSLFWSATYSTRKGFWTERHHAAALNIAISYWELSGDPKALIRINQLIDTLSEMTFSPSNNWRVRNCPQHTFKSHEGWGDNSPACSPWMMALLSDSLWRFYWLTDDQNAAKLLSAFATFMLNEGIYFGKKRLTGRVIPKYIVSLDNPNQEELEQWSDLKHTCDVAAMIGKGVYIKQQLKQDYLLEKQLFNAMATECKKDNLAVIEKYKYIKLKRLTSKPPRMFNWQYSTSDDLPWLMLKLNEL